MEKDLERSLNSCFAFESFAPELPGVCTPNRLTISIGVDRIEDLDPLLWGVSGNCCNGGLVARPFPRLGDVDRLGDMDRVGDVGDDERLGDLLDVDGILRVRMAGVI